MDKDNTNQVINHEFAPQYDLIKHEDIKFYMTNIPKAPDKETVKRLLLELPQQITFLDNNALDFKQEVGEMKVTLKARKNLLDIEKSEVRKHELEKFQVEHDLYMQKTQDLMREIMNSEEQNASLKKAYLQEVSRVLKPEKPTKADLDDIANIKTKHLQSEIDDLEARINDCLFELEILDTKKDFYNNMWITLRKYTDVVVNEMKMLGER